jgi:hypothetical protein
MVCWLVSSGSPSRPLCMGPTRQTNFPAPGRAGVGRLLAPTVFQSATNVKGRGVSAHRSSSDMEVKLICNLATTILALAAPCWDTAAADCGPLRAHSVTARVPAQGAGAHRIASQDPFAVTQADAGNSCVHTDLPSLCRVVVVVRVVHSSSLPLPSSFSHSHATRPW